MKVGRVVLLLPSKAGKFQYDQVIVVLYSHSVILHYYLVAFTITW